MKESKLLIKRVAIALTCILVFLSLPSLVVAHDHHDHHHHHHHDEHEHDVNPSFKYSREANADLHRHDHVHSAPKKPHVEQGKFSSLDFLVFFLNQNVRDNDTYNVFILF